MKQTVIIIGAGGHGKVIADTLSELSEFQLVGFVDDQVAIGSEVHLGVTCLGNVENILSGEVKADAYVVGIGNNTIRKNIHLQLEQSNLRCITLIHPRATVAPSVKLEDGAVVLQGAVVSTLSVLEKGCIIDAGSIVNHEAKIGAFSHLSVGTVICNNVTVNDGVKTSPGEIVEPFSTRS